MTHRVNTLVGRRLLNLLFFMLVPAIAQAATYYVSIYGSDYNSCYDAQSPQGARRSIAAGIACISGGETLIIGDGTYNEQILGTIPGGSVGAHTILQAENRYGVIMLPTSPLSGYAVINVEEPYITLDGIIVDATNIQDNGGYTVRSPFDVPLNNVTIKNGISRNGITPASVPSSEPSGILLDTGLNYIIQNMEIFNFRGHGIYNPSANILIENCYIHDWSSQLTISGYGIQNYPDPVGGIIRNNRITNYQQGLIVAGSNFQVYNNIFANIEFDAIKVSYGGTDTGIYSNTIYGAGGSSGGNTEGSTESSSGGDTGSSVADGGSTPGGVTFTSGDPLAAPAVAVSQCNYDGTFTLSWDSVPGADSYYVRIDYLNDNIWESPDYYFDGYQGTVVTGSVISGQVYVWWVHGANSIEIGPAVFGSFVCQ